MNVEQAAKIMGVCAQTVRVGLQRNIFPFGAAFKKSEESEQYTYVIYPGKFHEYCVSISTPEPMKNTSNDQSQPLDQHQPLSPLEVLRRQFQEGQP